MLFKVDNNDFFLTNPSASSIPEFAECNSNEMKYVAMYVDYLSPIRQQPDGERKRLAALAAGYPPQSTHDKTFQPKVREMINGQKPKVEAAIKKYRELQYNEDRELLRLYQTQIDSIKAMVVTPTTDAGELKKRNDLVLSLPDLRKSQRDLAKSVGMEDEIASIQEESQETRKMSTLDKVHNEESKLDD